MRAYVAIRDQPHYRLSSFLSGLKSIGCETRIGVPDRFDADTLFIAWNRYGSNDDVAKRVERAGGTVIVTENGYIGRDAEDRQLYALALSGHNGSGRWNVGPADRFADLGIALRPWRTAGDKIVIRGQRGIGTPEMRSPDGWMQATAERLRRLTKRPIQCIAHPGKSAESNREHEQYLIGAHALVVWASSVGVKALAMGVPVFYCAPHWICEGAAKRGIDELEAPLMDDAARLAAMRRMAWAQFRVDEIASGFAFRSLLGMEGV